MESVIIAPPLKYLRSDTLPLILLEVMRSKQIVY